MFQRVIDDLKESTGTALRQSSLAAATAIALFITTGFICAAVFILVLQNYGAVAACFSGAAIFLLVTLITAASYLVRKRQIERRARETAKSAAQTMLADPMVVAAGLQLVRSIGVKRLIPLLAVGGLALGLLAGRGHATDQTPAE
ncbi:hypothetical protein [Bradyrhizobium sp. NP1]|jgi:hypothetical protein|uniref:hypothetical protein n=1 Tax=Bradyrhizobium sp. NP1 TaxID=3049772 RepID=UPI0025A56C9D|nr:hypothetical protein [Bradyrhizobium sp. NP1]WJR77669.1 hypothetical protein QOU61_34010 [Bradyrhizobium sp. NP1]